MRKSRRSLEEIRALPETVQALSEIGRLRGGGGGKGAQRETTGVTDRPFGCTIG